MTDRGEHTVAAKTVNRSGFPFQLAVERELQSVGRRHGWIVAASEVPAADGFADIVLTKEGFICVVECKRVEDNAWYFLVPQGASSTVSDCRLEWRNPRAKERHPLTAGLPLSKIFASDFSLCEGSFESAVSVLPKASASHTLESIARQLLAQTHDLGDKHGMKYGPTPTYLIPVIVTNAQLLVCEYDQATLDLSSGTLGSAAFLPVDFVRFRKSLVTARSNDYERHENEIGSWAADRHRTVFIVSPGGLDRFLSGFRAFQPADGGEHPQAFLTPPSA